MKYFLAVIWALTLVLLIFGNGDGKACGVLLLINVICLQCLYWIGQLGESIGEVIRLRMEAKYAEQQMVYLQRERELALLEQIANK